MPGEKSRRALVIGGGIAGIGAALDIADAGHQVLLVERLPSIGGHMAQLSETFPTLDCSQCILTPRTVEVGHHPRIQLLTYAEVEALAGEVGDFRVKVRRKARFVDWGKCTGCGLCQEECPRRVGSEFDRGLGERKAIYTLFPQAVPNKPVIDAANCLFFTRGRCRLCERVCPVGAIDFDQEDETWEERVGAIVVASGYELFPLESLAEYGYGTHPDILDSLQFERLLSASGPTAGRILRPSDGKVPQEVAFLQCIGSRDRERGLPYCSKVCCMYTAKEALLYHHRVREGRAYVFYIDIRSAGKRYEEFVQKAAEEGVLYIRGKAARVFPQDGKLVVWGVDTLSGKQIELSADLVVLAPALRPSSGFAKLAQTLGLPLDGNGFPLGKDEQGSPLDSPQEGIYLAGSALGPQDIAEAVTQGSASAGRVLELLARWGGHG